MNKDDLGKNVLKGPYSISIDITNRCNLRCLHCYNYSGENSFISNELTDMELTKLICDLKKMKPFSICFCGGEPLMRKNLLFNLLEELKGTDIKTSLVTNGLLLDSDTAVRLSELGVGLVQISVDGIGQSHDKLRGFDGAYEKAVEALINLQKANINSCIAFTPTVWSINQIDDIVELCMNLNVKILRIQTIMPIGRGALNNKKIIPSQEQYKALGIKVNKIENQLMLNRNNLNIEWVDPIEFFIDSSMNEAACTFISIKANGNIAPSLYLPIAFGNIRMHSISDYWKAGMENIYSSDIFRDIVTRVTSIDELDVSRIGLPNNFKEEDVFYDIIDN